MATQTYPLKGISFSRLTYELINDLKWPGAADFPMDKNMNDFDLLDRLSEIGKKLEIDEETLSRELEELEKTRKRLIIVRPLRGPIYVSVDPEDETFIDRIRSLKELWSILAERYETKETKNREKSIMDSDSTDNSDWSSVEEDRKEYEKMVKSLIESSRNTKIPPFSYFQSGLTLQICGNIRDKIIPKTPLDLEISPEHLVEVESVERPSKTKTHERFAWMLRREMLEELDCIEKTAARLSSLLASRSKAESCASMPEDASTAEEIKKVKGILTSLNEKYEKDDHKTE